MTNLVLGSSSPYRKALLERLKIPFVITSPSLDETPLPGESVKTMVLRLSREKAIAVAKKHPGQYVIGSDQTAELDGHALNKPGTLENAKSQLAAASGKTITFHTGLCLVGPDGIVIETTSIPTTVHFRKLSTDEIEHYLEIEQPLDCAGSFKVEGSGITLFESVTSNDPTALMGLPLIKLTSLLKTEKLL